MTTEKQELKIIRLLMADDHASFRRVLGSVLSTEADLKIIGEASNGIEAVDKACELKPDVVIMDLRMPELNGVKATAAIKEKSPEVKILVLTLFDEADDLFNAMKSGAKGYLLKSAELDGLVAAIRQIALGNVIITPVLAARIISYFKTANRRKGFNELNTLTAQEKRVLELLAQGRSLSEIARDTSSNEDGVRADLKHALKKFQAS